jgi:uncharacterized membrane protein YesL
MGKAYLTKSGLMVFGFCPAGSNIFLLWQGRIDQNLHLWWSFVQECLFLSKLEHVLVQKNLN